MEENKKEISEKFIRLKDTWVDTKECEIELCELSVSIQAVINDFKFKSLPTPTPEYKKWRFMSQDEKDKFIKDNYNFYVINIKNFADDIDRINNFNNRNRNQLQEWLRLEISPESRVIIEQALDSHSGK